MLKALLREEESILLSLRFHYKLCLNLCLYWSNEEKKNCFAIVVFPSQIKITEISLFKRQVSKNQGSDRYIYNLAMALAITYQPSETMASYLGDGATSPTCEQLCSKRSILNNTGPLRLVRSPGLAVSVNCRSAGLPVVTRHSADLANLNLSRTWINYYR